MLLMMMMLVVVAQRMAVLMVLKLMMETITPVMPASLFGCSVALLVLVPVLVALRGHQQWHQQMVWQAN